MPRISKKSPTSPITPKIVFGIALIAAFSIIAIQAGNDLILGSLLGSDRALYVATYNASGIVGGLVTRDVVYTGATNITRIRAIDLALNGTGGFASLISGGIGQKNATLRLTASAAGRGIYFSVDIYGR